ncbi:hypothetical protein ACX80L_12540 [Arthrobacter sp. MDT1-48-3]
METSKMSASVRRMSVGASTVAVFEQRPRAGELVLTNDGRALTRTNAGGARRAAREKVSTGDGYHQLRPYHASQLIAACMSSVAVAHRLDIRTPTRPSPLLPTVA